MNKITIPQWLRKEKPDDAHFLEIINVALEEIPNISLADFAKTIHDVLYEESMERLKRAEAKQFRNGERE